MTSSDQPETPLWKLNLGFLAMVLGMFMAILDIQIVASSIRQIQAGVYASLDEIAWIQTGYLIAETVGIPLSGFLARALGLRLLFVLSAGSFVFASLLCSLAWDLDSLIVFRAVQGFAGAAMVPTAMGAAFTLFPSGQSMFQQVMVGMVATLAPSIGPTLGGWITEHASWHWLFLINIVPGIIAIVLVWTFIPGQKSDRTMLRKLDVSGLAAMAVFLGLLEWIIEEGPGEGWWQSGLLVRASIVCGLAGAIFFWRSLTQDVPIVELRAFRDRNFASGTAVGAVVGLGLFGSVYLTPLFLSQVRGYSALQIGEVMSVAGLAMFVAAPLTGWLTRSGDPRRVVLLGLLMCAAGTWLNSKMTAQTGFHELFWAQALRGAGLMMTMVPVTSLAMGTLPPQQVANASSIFTVARNLGGAVGIAVMNTQMLHFTRLHQQELASGMSLSRPEVQTYLDSTTDAMRAAGAADPYGAAVARLGQSLQLEATVMTFNNLFMSMSLAFALMLTMVLLMEKPQTAVMQPAH